MNNHTYPRTHKCTCMKIYCCVFISTPTCTDIFQVSILHCVWNYCNFLRVVEEARNIEGFVNLWAYSSEKLQKKAEIVEIAERLIGKNGYWEYCIYVGGDLEQFHLRNFATFFSHCNIGGHFEPSFAILSNKKNLKKNGFWNLGTSWFIPKIRNLLAQKIKKDKHLQKVWSREKL